jgi:hypothetical protein
LASGKLSWSHVLPQRVTFRRGIASLVQRSPSILGDSAAFDRDVQSPSALRPWILGCSRWRRPRRPLARRRGPLTESRLLQSLTTRRRPQWLQLCGASHEVSSPSAREDWRIHIPRACRTRFVPPPGFLTLLAASSPPAVRPCFMPVALVGFGAPSEPFPPDEAVAPLDARNPPCVCRRDPATSSPRGRPPGSAERTVEYPRAASAARCPLARIQGLAPRRSP